jgi:hypothetical protein
MISRRLWWGVTVVNRNADSAYAFGATSVLSARNYVHNCRNLEISTMQPARTLSDNIGAQPVELPNKHLAAATTRSQTSGDSSEMTRATTRGFDRRSTLAGAYHSATEMHDRIEIWVNEGGAGGEPDESTSRPRGG